ncbi:MAG: hypothetical protein H8E21_04395 [Gammaproteobacteria bacterium]|nr:hypothetical protein [Gammaproteobacteria bacterium]
MINFNLNFWHKIKHTLLASVVSISVISCGAAATAIVTGGISGTGIVFGVITGFGSIIVNGVHYDIDTPTSFDIDGNTIDNNLPNLGLGIGMVVKLDYDKYDDGSIVVTTVFYDDSIEGPVTSIIPDPAGNLNLKQIVVLGQTVIINATTTTFDGISFGDDPADTTGIAVGDVIEVSGFVDQDGSILATRVEKKDSLSSGNDVKVELRGTVTEVTPDVSFKLAGIIIHITEQPIKLKDLTSLSALAVGLIVEVKGLYQPDGSIIAEEIEREGVSQSDISNSSGSVSLQGFVTTAFDSTTKKLAVNAVVVDASAISSTITSLLVSGLEVEVKGDMNNGELKADKIEIRSAEARFKAQIKSVTNNSIVIGYPNMATSRTLLFNSRSQLVDELGVLPLTIANLTQGMEVNVSVVKLENDWVVNTLKRRTLKEYQAEGIVTAKSATSTLTISGFQIDVSAVSDYQINDVDKTATEFFAAIVEGSTIVKLEDDDKDGVFEKAEID